MDRPFLLLTNDDGIGAPGLARLAEALAPLGDIVVFAPDRERSAVGHGVTLRRPLRVTETQPGWFMVDGTPADCVILAVRGLLDRRPDMVVSGINAGANLGDDATYSGTVAGAYEGMLLGLPSVAVSIVDHNPKHYDAAMNAAASIASHILDKGLPADTMLNVNVPDAPVGEIGGMTLTKMGRRNYQDEIVRRKDPRGGMYYWIGGANPDHHTTPGSDFEAIEAGRISVTPLMRNLTAHAAMEEFRGAAPFFQS